MQQVLTFHLANEQYGLEIDAIQEIVEDPALFYIPAAADCFLGALNFHGSIVPVIDLARVLDFPVAERDERIIVIRSEVAALGLAVGRLGTIISAEDAEVLPGDGDRRSKSCISGVFDLNGSMLNLLDLTVLFTRLEVM